MNDVTAFDITAAVVSSIEMPVTAINPFFFESPSDKWAFTDREQLTGFLNEFFVQSKRRLLIHGRRRMGKTSLLKNAARMAGRVIIFVDVSTAASIADICRKLLEAAPTEQKDILSKALDVAKKHFKSFAITAGKIALSGELQPKDGEKTLQHVLSYLNDRAALDDVPWTVCFDEFQDFRTLGAPRADWLIRGLIQDHDHLNYVFTGSDDRLVAWMTDPTAAFFKQLQQMEVGPIDPTHMAAWIDSRSKTGGLADAHYGNEIVNLAGPSTGDIVRLAKVTFDMAASGQSPTPVTTAFDAIALVELNSEFHARWSDSALGQKGILRAIAFGHQPTASSTLREYGIKSASTAQSAVTRLLERQILIRREGGVHFDNPFFRRWVQFNTPLNGETV